MIWAEVSGTLVEKEADLCEAWFLSHTLKVGRIYICSLFDLEICYNKLMYAESYNQPPVKH